MMIRLHDRLSIIIVLLAFQSCQLCALQSKAQMLDPPPDWYPDPCLVDFDADGIVGGGDFSYLRKDGDFATYREQYAAIVKHMGEPCARNKLWKVMCPELRQPPHCVELRIDKKGGFILAASELPGCEEATR